MNALLIEEEYDEEGHCIHVNYEIEMAEYDVMRNGTHDTESYPVAECPNPKCDGITDSEQEALTEKDEPDYDDES